MIQNPKISVIMPSYLGEYSGSRKNPIAKFHRAVSSFLQNTYTNSELVIVSDGCQITHEEYLNNYRGNSRIKYAFIDRDEEKIMYSKSDGENYYRGSPRRIGVSLADGQLITYLDSDDYFTNSALETIINSAYLKSPESSWWINTSHFDERKIGDLWRQIMSLRERGISYNAAFDPLIDILEPFSSETYNFPEIEAEFVKTKLKKGNIVGGTLALTHRREIDVYWQDTIGISEDTDFSRRLRERYKGGFLYDNPIYVRCHYRGVWDV